jgi:nucleolar protein 4
MKRDALNAIKQMNEKYIDKRKIILSLAQTKEQYASNPKIEKIEKVEKFERIEKLNKTRETKPEEKIPEQNETKSNKKLLNDPKRTIFIRNLGFNTDEKSLQTFFSKHGHVIYVKIVKDKETHTSKGTAFVMFARENEAKEILELYHKYDGSDDNINPFELDGRNLHILSAMSKEDAVNLEKSNLDAKNQDKRRKDLLYYGLNLKDDLISGEDMEKREHLIKLKKGNFSKNPNYHVSTTRITIRNFGKDVTEDKLKGLAKEAIDAYVGTLPPKNEYLKVKKVKQVKLLRDKNELDKNNELKSKCCAFVEVYDENLAKAVIDYMTNMKLSKKNERRGLILDFALDDIRKVSKMKKKLEMLKEKRQSEKISHNEEEGVVKAKTKVKESKPKDKALDENETKVKVETIEDINDVKKLLEIYRNTVGRGKKQRIGKKLKRLGYTGPLETVNNLENKNKAFEKVKTADLYSSTKIENAKTNLNKKFAQENKLQKQQAKNDEKKSENKLLNKKRKRAPVEEEYADSEDDGIDMSHYIAQINKNLKK